jgi:hypothetical protein
MKNKDKEPPLEAIQLKTEGGGLLAIRKDAVFSVEAQSYGSRNTACLVNGFQTQSGYDFVLTELGWRVGNTVP